MFYYVLFFISALISTLTHAEIAQPTFEPMLEFIASIDLNTARSNDYQKFMNLAEQIVDNGSEEQRSQLRIILDKTQQPTPIDIVTSLQKADDLLKSDIITQDVWQKSVMGPLLQIDAKGTPEEKAQLNDFIGSHKELILHHCKALISTLQLDLDVKNMLKFIVMNTLLGVLPGMVLKGLSATIGNIPIDQAATQLTDLSILCALDSIIRYGLKNQPEFTQATVAAGFSTAIQSAINFTGTAPTDLTILGATITTPQLASIQAAMTVLAKYYLKDNIQKIATNLDWQDMLLGEQQLVSIEPEKTKTLTNYLQNAITIGISGKHKAIIKTALKNTVSYAIEGALLAAALNAMGLGAYGSTTEAALIAGMTRGALESLIQHYSDRSSGRAGILERVENGIIASSVQKFLTGGATAAMTDMIPLVTQQVLAGAVNGVIQKAGGWKTFVTNLFAK